MRETPYVTPTKIDILKRPDGTLILSNPHPLQAAFENVIAPLAHWAQFSPNKTWLAGKENGQWREVSYSKGWEIVQNLAAHLNVILPPKCVVAIGSSNSLYHAFLTYALPLCGRIPAPITPAYSTKASDNRRLKEALEVLEAKAVFYEDDEYTRAIDWAKDLGVLVLTKEDLNAPPLRGSRFFDGQVHQKAVGGEKTCPQEPTETPIHHSHPNQIANKQIYPAYIKSFAREMRKTPTEAERLLWKQIRANQTGYKFRRQFSIDGKYIADFVCLEKRLIIEIDGGQHDENPYDVARTSYLENANFRVIRFWNNEIINNIDGCVKALKAELGIDVSDREIDILPPTEFFAQSAQNLGSPARGERLDQIDPQSPAKILLTSGSTGVPKAVVITHYNLAQNAAQIRSTFDPAKEAQIWPDGIVMVNHLPWSHSLGGNAILHMLTHSGGTLWIDDGAPTEAGLSKTIEAIKRVKPNYHNTVPLGWTLLLGAIEADDELARALFENLVIMQYGGAALTQDVFERLQAKARQITGDEITLAAGYGATETGPTVCNVHWANRVMGLVGLPVPGLELKLVPIGDKYDARVKGPAIIPYYLNDSAKTKAAFDDEGFYFLGDALAFYDIEKPELGLKFDGRTSEEFKVLNGSFVQVGNVRTSLIACANGIIKDAIICGEGKAELGAMVFLNQSECNNLLGQDLPLDELSRNPIICEAIKTRAREKFAQMPTTKAIRRIILLADNPSLEDGEITDKGYLNQARCRQNRAKTLDILYKDDPSVIII